METRDTAPNTNPTRSRLKRGIFALAGLAILFAYVATIYRNNPTAGVTLENFENLRLDMSNKDVEWFLGPPTGAELVEFFADGALLPEGGTAKQWEGENLEVWITFDALGRAKSIRHATKSDGIWRVHPSTAKPKQTLTERIRIWIGWR